MDHLSLRWSWESIAALKTNTNNLALQQQSEIDRGKWFKTCKNTDMVTGEYISLAKTLFCGNADTKTNIYIFSVQPWFETDESLKEHSSNLILIGTENHQNCNTEIYLFLFGWGGGRLEVVSSSWIITCKRGVPLGRVNTRVSRSWQTRERIKAVSLQVRVTQSRLREKTQKQKNVNDL